MNVKECDRGSEREKKEKFRDRHEQRTHVQEEVRDNKMNVRDSEKEESL